MSLTSQLGEVLRLERNPDGGWGYYPGKRSRLEATCWALLALPDADPAVLRTWPTEGGLLLERDGGEPNYAFHALALVTLLARDIDHANGTTHLLEALQQARGAAHEPSTINRQDHRFQGWSWIAQTASWVEPTAWALLALKQWKKRRSVRLSEARIHDGEAVLIDRCCAGGGWNYGNSNMLGRELKPYVPTTALALIALQDQRNVPEVKRSVDYLARASSSEPSGMSLSLAILALNLLERDSTAASQLLLAQLNTTVLIRNQVGIALTLLALGPNDASPLAL